MGLFEKTNPTGIDKPIQRMQSLLYSRLGILGYTDINGFGRAYVHRDKDDKKIPHRYVKGSKGDYEEILFNDTVNGHFFFIDSSETKPESGMYETDVDIIFFFDLPKIKPNVNHRADEEVRSELISEIERYRWFEIKNIIKDEKALDDFDTDITATQPRFFLKVTGTLRHQFNC